MLLVAAAVVVLGKAKPPGKGASHRARFEFAASGRVSTNPTVTWFEAYDYNWEGNKRSRVDWSSGYIRDSHQDTTDFTIHYETEGPTEPKELAVGPCIFSGVKIQSFNKNLKRPYFSVAFRGPADGEMYVINTGGSPSQTASEVVRMEYDPTVKMGSWTVEIGNAYLVDISDENAQGILGLIEHVTFVITRTEKI